MMMLLFWIQLNGFYRLLGLFISFEIEATSECVESVNEQSTAWNRHELQTFPYAITTHSSQFDVVMSKMLFPCNKNEIFTFGDDDDDDKKMKWNKMKRNKMERIEIYIEIFSPFIKTKWVPYAVVFTCSFCVQSLHRFPLHLHYIRFFLCVRRRRFYFGYPSGLSLYALLLFNFHFSFSFIFLAGCFNFHHHPRSHRIDWICRREKRSKSAATAVAAASTPTTTTKREKKKYLKNVTAKRRSNISKKKFFTYIHVHSRILLLLA